jgi:hypothetical protein
MEFRDVARTMAVGALALAAGCSGGSTYSYSGYVRESYFPFDGARSWEFVSSDATLSHKIVAELDPNSQVTGDGIEIFSIDYWLECLEEGPLCDGEEPLRTVKWSADQTLGVAIHASGADSWDPPVVIASPKMAVGDTAVTESGGVTFTSTFDSITGCPVKWTDAWDECVRILVDDGGAGVDIAGEYFAVVGYNVVAMQLTGDTGQWQLSFAQYEEL